MKEATGEKKPAQGGLSGRCCSAVRKKRNDLLAQFAHGRWVNKDRLAYFVLAGAAFFGLYGSSHSLAHARSLDAPSPPIEQIQVGLTDIVDAVALGATQPDQLAAQLIGNGVVLVAPIPPDSQAVAKNETNQARDQRGGKLDNRTTQQLLEALLLHCVISFSVSLLLGYAWAYRPWF